MAHVGQKLALGLAGGLGGLGGDPGLLLLLPKVDGGGVVLEHPQGFLLFLAVAGHGEDRSRSQVSFFLPEKQLHLVLFPPRCRRMLS